MRTIRVAVCVAAAALLPTDALARTLRRQLPVPILKTCKGHVEGVEYTTVTQLLMDAMMPVELDTQHMVAIVPNAPTNEGGDVLARLFASLPKSGGDLPYRSKFSKVVMVVPGRAGADGLLVGQSVCTAPKVVDTAAAEWLKVAVTRGPGMPGIGANSADAGSTEAVERLMAFVSIAMENKVNGNILPVVNGEQNPDGARKLAAALHSLVTDTGVYSRDRVLFLIISDLSSGLTRKDAKQIDAETAKIVTLKSFDQLEHRLQQVKASDPKAAPTSEGNLLAATLLLTELGLDDGGKVILSDSGAYAADADRNDLQACTGYGSFAFWRDQRPQGQKPQL